MQLFKVIYCDPDSDYLDMSFIKKLSDLKLDVTSVAKYQAIKIKSVDRIDNDFFAITIGKIGSAENAVINMDFINDLNKIGIQTKKITSKRSNLILLVLKL